MGRRALEVMSFFYASITGTQVIQQKHIPERPSTYDGGVQLFGLDKALWTEEALRTDMSHFGSVVSCEICPALVDLKEGAAGREVATVHKANAVVRFTTHAEAETAIGGLAKQERGAAFLYNSTPYDGKGGRGLCMCASGIRTGTIVTVCC